MFPHHLGPPSCKAGLEYVNVAAFFKRLRSGLASLRSPHRHQAQHTPYRFRPRQRRIIRGNPQIEQFEIIGLKADRDWYALSGSYWAPTLFCDVTN